MTKPIFLSSLIALATLVLSRPAIADTDLVTEQLAVLRNAAKCNGPRSPFRPWCIVADFGNGKVADLPKGKTFVGITIMLESGADARAALNHHVTPAALVVDDKGMVIITDITPSNDAEKTSLGEAVVNLVMVFKGQATIAKLPADLVSYIKSMTASYKPTKSATEWTWMGKSAARLRKVGKYWVSIETPPAKNGIWASLFTDAWE